MLTRLLALVFAGICSLATASTMEPPETFMQNTTTSVLEQLKQIPPGDMPKVYAVIEKEIVPVVDIEYMARWVVGRKAWSKASAEEQKLFTEVFEKLMSKTYASTLLLFKDRTMIYSRPMRVDYQKAKTIPVYCEIKQPNKESIQVIYQMRMMSNQWKIFDVLVEGVSMLKGLQAQYEQVIAQKGINGGIEAMQQKLNSSAATDPSAKASA
jgi:phospholipid transport system substrate-binding protein